MRIPRVLMGTPTSDRHSHLIDEWIGHLNSLTYPFDLFLIDTSQNFKYFEKLKRIKFTRGKLIVRKHKWNSKKLHPVQMLAHVREKIRQYFLKEDYHYLMWLDDDIFLPKRGIQKLISYDKDCVGFYVHIFHKPKRAPCVLKSGEILLGKKKCQDFFTFSEIEEYYLFAKRFQLNELNKNEKRLVPFLIKDKNRPFLFEAYGVNLGCLLCKRKVMENIPFRTHPTFVYGEDLWFFSEANDKHFKFWCDSSYRCKHKNTEWDSIAHKSDKSLGFNLIMGPEDKINKLVKNE